MNLDLPKKRPVVAIASIMKNEGPYIVEWLAWHRLLGVERFFIADNESDDGLSVILTSLAEQGVVNHIVFPTPAKSNPQTMAYQHIVDNYGQEVDWIFFIDADEFIHTEDSSVDLHRFISSLDEDVGAVCLNWAIYGSSGRVKAGQGLVTTRFVNRASETQDVNKHYKSLIRTSAISGSVGRSVHHIEMHNKFRRVNTRRENIEFDRRTRGISQSVVWDQLRLNHYVIKSWSEFWLKKVARGRATCAKEARDQDFFGAHDLNEVYDPLDRRICKDLADEISNLKGKLASLPSWVQDLDKSICEIVPPPEDYPAMGHVDCAAIENGNIILEGWALTPGRKAVDAPEVYINDLQVNFERIIRINRLDVRRAYPGCDLECGYKIFISSNQVAMLTNPIRVEIRQQPRRLSFGPPKEFHIIVNNNSQKMTVAAGIMALRKILGYRT